jgi:Ca2+-binding EF-hand superfamily protein
MENALKRADKDKDGRVDLEELRIVLAQAATTAPAV